jgi:AraC-like DNA-binding protein
METVKDLLPAKLLSRKDEITADFIALAENHIASLMAGTAPKRLSASDFGKLLFIHPRHLTTTLKLTMGSSVCDYMENRIIEEASRLLTQTDISIADIGQRFAYSEATNFTKFFKGMTGMTPLQFRKSHLKS